VDTAVLDACLLFRGGVRDFLLWVAEAGAFSPVWSDTIHEEWMRSRRDKFGDPMSRLNYAREAMEKAFPGANFDPDPETLSTISLPDMNDIHAVATAVAAQAKSIVTYNVRHFSDAVLGPLGLRVETPDEFCARLFHETPTDCQSASDRDPGSASNRDPLVLRFERLALAPSELVGVAETGRARVGV
jgi:predicted nucleic acid-binding protein